MKHIEHAQCLNMLFQLFIAVLLLCKGCSATQHTQPPHPTKSNFAPVYQGRVFFHSNTAPIASALNFSNFTKSTRVLIDHFSYIEQYIQNALFVNRENRSVHFTNGTRGSSKHRPSLQSLQICNSQDSDWDVASRAVSLTNGWFAVQADCVSEIYGIPPQPLKSSSSSNSTYNLPKYSLHEMQDAFRDRSEQVRTVAEQIKKSTVSNWTHISFRGNDSIVLNSISCSVRFTSAVRVLGSWYIRTSLLSIPQSHWVKERDREIISEYIGVHNNTLVVTNLTLPVNPVNGTEHRFQNDATTRIGFWNGASSTSSFYRQTAEENHAIKDAMDLARSSIQHADGALFWSNIAILVLPLFLNLIPVSLVTNIRSRLMMAVIIFGDILGALPMMTKGIEIITISEKSYLSIFTKMSDPSSDTPQTSHVISGELWVAQCNAKHDIGRTGMILVLIALASSIVGVFIELGVHLYGKQTQQKLFQSSEISPELLNALIRKQILVDVDTET